MIPRSWRFSWALVGVCGLSACRLAGVPEPGPPPAPEAAAEPPGVEAPPTDEPVLPTPYAEVRALWVVRTTLTSPERVRAMVAEAHGAGFNTLLVQVRGRADAYYRSLVEPLAPALKARQDAFDPLALLLEEAHARGLEVHAWLSVNLVWGVGPLPDDPGHLVRARPDLLALPRELVPELGGMDPFHPSYLARLHQWTVARQTRLEGLYTDPALPAVRARVVAVVEDLVRRYALDGIHLDYVRYASPEFGYSAAALAAFGADPRLDPQGFGDFRRSAVTELVRQVRAVVAAHRPALLLSAAVFPDPADAASTRFQAWGSWLRDGLVDVVVPMAYTDDDARFRTLARLAVEEDPRSGQGVWLGVGAYLTGLDQAVGQVARAREAGVRGVAVFSYDWASTEAPPVAGGSWLGALGARAFGTEMGRVPSPGLGTSSAGRQLLPDRYAPDPEEEPEEGHTPHQRHPIG